MAMSIAGIDFSSRFVDVVLLDEDTDAAEWHRFDLQGQDAFERARYVRRAMWSPASSWWDEIIAVGIEDPRGYNAGALYRVQGAILSCIPNHNLVQPFIPSQWRKTVGMPGNASKKDVQLFADAQRVTHALWGTDQEYRQPPMWPQDACDALCIAMATRSLLQRTETAA